MEEIEKVKVGSIELDVITVLGDLPKRLKPGDLQKVVTDGTKQSLGTMNSIEISSIGVIVEKNFNTILDNYLRTINAKNSQAVMKLFDELIEKVDAAELPKLIEEVQNGKPSFFKKLFGKTVEEFIAELGEKLSLQTKTLHSEVEKIEKKVQTEVKLLLEDLAKIEKLQNDYTVQEYLYLLEVGRLRILSAKSHAEAEAIIDNQEKDRFLNKLAALDNRMIALDTMYTRLPLEAQTLDQIKSNGILILQETFATVGGRMASIKMNLIKLSSLFTQKTVIRSQQKLQSLDRSLGSASSTLNREITQKAGESGLNRQKEVDELKLIKTDLGDIRKIVADNREKNFAIFSDLSDQLELIRSQN